LEALLLDRRPTLHAAAAGTAMALTQADGPLPVVSMYRGRRQSPKPAELREETARPPRHAHWVAIYEAVHTLRAQGMPLATIARRLGIGRPTVYAYLRRDTPPGRRRFQWRPAARVLTPYIPWRETQADSMQLWREIQALGYTHSARTVCRFITRLRRAADAGHPPESQGSPYTRPQGPSARAVSFARVSPAVKRSLEAQTYVHQLCQADTGIARAHALSQAFLAMVRERRGEDLEAWLAEATHSGIDELACVARGLQEDLPAVTAGLTLEWSNGVTEGQIYCLKLVKRQGHGRAGFALLRQRVLQVA
jgi:transposase